MIFDKLFEGMIKVITTIETDSMKEAEVIMGTIRMSKVGTTLKIIGMKVNVDKRNFKDEDRSYGRGVRKDRDYCRRFKRSRRQSTSKSRDRSEKKCHYCREP